MVVTVDDSNKGLNYVAAGVGRYNNKEVVGSPAILSGCTAQYRYRNPFSAGALLAPEAQCWGELYSRVDTAGNYLCTWKSNFYGAFVLNHRVVLHAIDASPAR